jgi:hypothetical protein
MKAIQHTAQVTLVVEHGRLHTKHSDIVDALMNEVRDRKTDLRVTVVDPLEDNPVSLW